MNFRLVYIVFLMLGLSGCSLLMSPKAPDISTYVITGRAQPLNLPAPRTRQILMVATPMVNAGYDSNRMIYVQVPYKLRAFAKNQWIAPPAPMIAAVVAQSLRNRAYFRAVVMPPFTGNVNYVLNLHLLVLQQEFFQPTSQVRLVMQATLLSSGGQVIASRRFVQVNSAAHNNPYSGVLATNRAATKISRQISSFVLRNVRK